MERNQSADTSSRYTQSEVPGMFASLRFLWNATRGHRFTPWRSEYLKWRIETFSGKKAESLSGSDVFRFLWESRKELIDFLAWTGEVGREARHRPSSTQDSGANV